MSKKLKNSGRKPGIPKCYDGKESACQCGFNPWVGKIPWKRKWQPTPVFLLGISQGRRSLAGYSPWDRKESGMTEHACMHISININIALDRLWSECLSEYNLIFPLSLPFFFLPILFTPYHMPDTVMSSGDMIGNTEDVVPTLWRFSVEWER